MKRVSIFSIFAFFSLSVLGQSGEVTNAILAQKDGALEDAKTSIDKASAHEKTIGEPKTWYYKGKIYESIANDPTLGKQHTDAAKIAFDSYTKARELDATAAKPGKYKKDLDEAFASQSFAIALQNAGIIAYQAKNYGVAHDYFVKYQVARPQDTLGYVYAAQMAMAKDDFKNAKESYSKCLEKTGYSTREIYTNLLYIYKSVESERDYNKALEIAQKARTKFPTDQNFLIQEVDLLEKTGKLQDAITSLEGIVQKGEAKLETYLLLGSSYEKAKNFEKAKQAYGKALELNPNSFEANFNMGAILYNPAAEISKTVRAMGGDEYNKKGKQMEANAKEILKQSQPYFEKAYAIKPEDASVKQILKDVYNGTNQKEKAATIK